MHIFLNIYTYRPSQQQQRPTQRYKTTHHIAEPVPEPKSKNVFGLKSGTLLEIYKEIEKGRRNYKIFTFNRGKCVTRC
jgi:hypothetical protein